MRWSEQHPDGFAASFETAATRLQICVEQACGSAAAVDWPARVAAATRAALAFAANDPVAANLLANEAVAQGTYGRMRYERLMGHFAERLGAGREHHPDAADPPDFVERAVIGGVAFLIARRLDQGRASELREAAPCAIEFILSPFVGEDTARRAVTDTDQNAGRIGGTEHHIGRLKPLQSG